jgi:hypothetical protein
VAREQQGAIAEIRGTGSPRNTASTRASSAG